MDKPIEIRWHGRGGQGAKTASSLLAEAASQAGKYAQGFPEYGPERMGAPVLAFNRISDRPLTVHCNVAEPQIVVVLDPTLIGKAKVTEGLTDDGIILVNTSKDPAEMRKRLGLTHGRVFCIDASKIAMETIGRDIPNTPLVGALVRIAHILERDEFFAVARALLAHKFANKKSVIDGNVQAMRRAYEEVVGE